MSYREQPDKIFNNVNFSGHESDQFKNFNSALVPNTYEEKVELNNFQMMVKSEKADSKDFR
jgi:hypothetical protein